MSSTKYMSGNDKLYRVNIFDSKGQKVVPPEFNYVDPSIKFTSALESQRELNLKSQENFKKKLTEIREEIDSAMESNNKPLKNFKRIKVLEKFAHEEMRSIKRVDQIASIKNLPKSKIVLYDFENNDNTQKSKLKEILQHKEKNFKDLYSQLDEKSGNSKARNLRKVNRPVNRQVQRDYPQNNEEEIEFNSFHLSLVPERYRKLLKY